MLPQISITRLKLRDKRDQGASLMSNTPALKLIAAARKGIEETSKGRMLSETQMQKLPNSSNDSFVQSHDE